MGLGSFKRCFSIVINSNCIGPEIMIQHPPKPMKKWNFHGFEGLVFYYIYSSQMVKIRKMGLDTFEKGFQELSKPYKFQSNWSKNEDTAPSQTYKKLNFLSFEMVVFIFLKLEKWD